MAMNYLRLATSFVKREVFLAAVCFFIAGDLASLARSDLQNIAKL